MRTIIERTLCSEKDCTEYAIVEIFITINSLPSSLESIQKGRFLCKDHFNELCDRLNLVDDNGNSGINYTLFDPYLPADYEEPLTDFDMENDDII